MSLGITDLEDVIPHLTCENGCQGEPRARPRSLLTAVRRPTWVASGTTAASPRTPGRVGQLVVVATVAVHPHLPHEAD